MLIFALVDERNTAPQANLAPFVIGTLVVAIGFAFRRELGLGHRPRP